MSNPTLTHLFYQHKAQKLLKAIQQCSLETQRCLTKQELIRILEALAVP